MTKPLFVTGMHGLGDNVHQRALVRRLLATDHDIWLRTPWPCLYHDLAGDRLHLMPPGHTLRTQAKNAQREAQRYTTQPPPPGARPLRVWYDHNTVRTT